MNGPTGALFGFSGNATVGTSAAIVVASHPRSRGFTIQNEDASVAIRVGCSAAEVSGSNGFLISAGQSHYFDYAGNLWAKAASSVAVSWIGAIDS